jgi:putative ABC transport system permease protein
MRDWHAYVRERLSLPGLTPERESRVVRELAAQLEDFHREALARGLDEPAADAHACAQIRDWDGLARALRSADHAHARPRLERAVNALEARSATTPGGLQMFADMLNDVRYAMRQLIKTPGFTVVAILTLAFGVGATSAIFSVVNSVLLKPLPYPDAASLVRVYERVPNYGRFAVAPATFLDWREQNTVFSSIATYGSSTATVDLGSGPERLTGSTASADLFDVLNVAPALGRAFSKAEDAPGKTGVVVLSHGMWQARFGGDPGVLGRTITMNGEPVVVVGVMPASFYFPSRETQYWRPIGLPPAPTRGGHYLGVIARLKPGVPVQQAGTEMAAISERLATQYPENSANESAETLSLHDQVVGPIRPMLITLFAAVFVVVLIACANVANLLLVRASIREKEIAIRAAMGAGRRRLIRQMLTESLVLAAAGGALGVALAYFAITPIQTLSAGSIPRAADIALDARVLGFAFLLSVATGVLFGLAPAWQASRAGLGAVLKEGGRSSSTGGGRWMRNALLVAEVALSIVLLVGATLLIRSFSRLTNVDPGFRSENVLAFQVSLPQVSYAEDHNRITFFDTLLDRLRSTPGVESAGMVQTLPLRGGYVLSFSVEGRPPAQPGEEPSANHRVVSPDYFSTLGIPLLRGRALTASDTVESPMVAVIDQAFVGKYFPNEDPIGRGIDISNGTDGAYRIVGIVGDVKYEGLEATTDPTMYVPHKQDVFGTMWVLARTSSDPAAMIATARGAVRGIDPSLPAYSMTPLADVVSESVAERRFSMLLLGLFAGVALFLAAVGLYGVVSYTVSQRTQEIGLRMAIGAEPGQVMRMVVGGGMKLALLGVVLGIAAALGLANLVASMLFGVTPFDPVSYALTAGVLLVVAALACYLPARRAMRVDPIIAMRHQ